jgi:hypothetical protein
MKGNGQYPPLPADASLKPGQKAQAPPKLDPSGIGNTTELVGLPMGHSVSPILAVLIMHNAMRKLEQLVPTLIPIVYADDGIVG